MVEWWQHWLTRESARGRCSRMITGKWGFRHVNLGCPPRLRMSIAAETGQRSHLSKQLLNIQWIIIWQKYYKIILLFSLFLVSHNWSIILLANNETEQKKGEGVKCKSVIYCFLGVLKKAQGLGELETIGLCILFHYYWSVIIFLIHYFLWLQLAEK